MKYIKDNLEKINASISDDVVLVAVSKTKPISDLQEAYDAGQRVFGENKIQEMVAKYDALPKDIQWHMIGHLQSNKVKYMAHFVDLIHGVDSFKTLKEINKQAKKHDRIISCLLQVRIAKEETKFGLPYEEISTILHAEELKNLTNINIAGFMGMATFTSDETILDEEFSLLKFIWLHTLQLKIPKENTTQGFFRKRKQQYNHTSRIPLTAHQAPLLFKGVRS